MATEDREGDDGMTGLVAGMAGAAMLGLVVSWSREMARAAGPLRSLMGVDEPVTEDEIRATAGVLITVLQSMVLGKSEELDRFLEPFSAELDRLAEATAEANCLCPKHRAAKEAASGAGPTA